jgi:hypothetical protein
LLRSGSQKLEPKRLKAQRPCDRCALFQLRR